MLVRSCQQPLDPKMPAERALRATTEMFAPVHRRLNFLIELLLEKNEELSNTAGFGYAELADFLENVSETIEDIDLTVKHIEAFNEHARARLRKRSGDATRGSE